METFTPETDFISLVQQLVLSHIENYSRATTTTFVFEDLAKIAEDVSGDLRIDKDLLDFLRAQNNLLQTMNVRQTYNCYQFRQRLPPITDVDLEHRQNAIFLNFFLQDQPIPPHIAEEFAAIPDFYKRLYIRLKLLMHGWADKNVESSLKCNCGLTWELNENYIWLSLIRTQLKIEDINISRKIKGRPKVPEEVATIFKKHLNDKKKETISRKYQVYNICKQLTQEDMNVLCNLVQHSDMQDAWKAKMGTILSGLKEQI